MKLLNFHYYPCLIYIIFRVLTNEIRFIIRHFFGDKYLKNISPLFLMFLGESFAGFLYIYERKLSSNQNNINEKEIVMKQIEKKKKYNYFIKFNVLFIALCSLLDFFFCFDFSIFYNSKINNLNEKFQPSKRIFFILILCLSENYFFNFEINNHHYLGLVLSVLSLLLTIINNLLKIQYNSLLFLIVLLYVQFGFIGSSLYLIEKKLNFKYYINVYYICFIEGIFGCLYCLISYLTLKKNFNIFLLRNVNYNEILTFIILIIIDCILTCIYNICRLKISEKNRPSYNIISEVLWVFFSTVSDSILKKKSWGFELILYYFFSLLGSCIYCEVISLNFCGLNKNTFSITAKRAKMEIYCLKENNDSSNDDSSNDNIF